MSPQRSYEGGPLDCSWQYFHERPAAQDGDGETVYATDPEPVGEERTEDVPIPDGGQRDRDGPVDDVDGQTTWDDWGGGSA